MENRDEKLWQLATKRARFKGKVYTYLAVNVFLWGIWYFSGDHHHNEPIPWPAWVSLGWGFALAINYVKLYYLNSDDQVQKEYDKLKEKN